MATIHIIGAGVSGLACAVRAALAGTGVALYESANHAGGRARSFKDESLACTIDNGNHLLLGSNEATRAYLSDIGAEREIREIAPAAFPFLDAATGDRWRVRPGRAMPPSWLLFPERRVPGTFPGDYLKQAYRLFRAGPNDTVAMAVGTGSPLYRGMWEPLCRAALNTDPSEASARLMWTVIRETFLSGEAACRPVLFRNGLSPALVTPALRFLRDSDADVRFSARLRGLRWADHRVTSLYFPEGMLRVTRGDAVVLALPADNCNEIWPEASAPTDHRTIVNIHYRLEKPLELPWDMPFLGVLGAEVQWAFVRDNILSLTISDADDIAERPNWDLASRLWAEMGRLLDFPTTRMPPWRVIKERRATFAQTPAQTNHRPGARTSLRNLFLAGDWTDTGLPATIEGSIRSGFRAATLALDAIRQAATEEKD